MVTISYATAQTAIELRQGDFTLKGTLRRKSREDLTQIVWNRTLLATMRQPARAAVETIETAVASLVRSMLPVDGKAYLVPATLGILHAEANSEILPLAGHPREVAILMGERRVLREPPMRGFAFTDDAGDVVPTKFFETSVAILNGRAIAFDRPASAIFASIVAGGHAIDATDPIPDEDLEAFWTHWSHHVSIAIPESGTNPLAAADIDLLQRITEDDSRLKAGVGPQPSCEDFLWAAGKLLGNTLEEMTCAPGVLAYCRRAETSIALFSAVDPFDPGWNSLRAQIAEHLADTGSQDQCLDLATCNVDLAEDRLSTYAMRIAPFLESGTLLSRTGDHEFSSSVWDHGDVRYFVSRQGNELWVATWTKDRPPGATVH